MQGSLVNSLSPTGLRFALYLMAFEGLRNIDSAGTCYTLFEDMTALPKRDYNSLHFRLLNKFQRSLSLFPMLLGVLTFTGVCIFLFSPEPSVKAAAFAAVLLIIYLLPVTVYRLINKFLPLTEGVSYINITQPYSAWMGAQKIQLIYNAFPCFEKFLILTGLYSPWLRLWGSQIGKQVYWTPNIQIVDRTHIEVGDGAFLGNHCYLSPHIVKRKNGKFMLVFKTIKIGRGVFIGAYSRIGPGCEIADGVDIGLRTDLIFNQKVTRTRDPKRSLSGDNITRESGAGQPSHYESHRDRREIEHNPSVK
jgi:hypothetical protein